MSGPGAGPAMKMSPIGIYAHVKDDISALMSARDIGRITHTDTRSIAGGILQANSVYLLLKGVERKEFIGRIADICVDIEEIPKKDAAAPGIMLKDKISWIENNPDASIDRAVKEIGNSGASFECHPFVLFMFQKYWNNPVRGLIETINCGGDTDTTGAIYGALLGAKEGMIFNERLSKPLGYQEIDKMFDLGRSLADINR
jgi:ADP-ribosylglycohydrolase